MRSVGLRSTSVRAEQRFTEPLAPFALVECVAAGALELPVPPADALKTHFTPGFSPKYCFPERKSFPPGTGEGGHEPHDMSPAPRSGQVGGYDFELLHQEGRWFFLNLAVIRQKSFVVSGF